jgi:hypothetical protein
MNSNIQNDISINISQRISISDLNQNSINDNMSSGSYKNAQISNLEELQD